MKKMGYGLTAVIVIIAVIVMAAASTYNGLVSQQENVAEKRSNISVMMQRRADLIPNLVSTVQGYSNHEEAVFTEIAEARSKLSGAIQKDDLQEMENANNQIEAALGRLIAIAEAYPQLQASQQYTALMDQLEGCENRIAVARTEYTSCAKQYNANIRRFPTNIFANVFGFDQAEYFEASEGAENAPVVNFD